jgi:hypothetical protein
MGKYKKESSHSPRKLPTSVAATAAASISAAAEAASISAAAVAATAAASLLLLSSSSAIRTSCWFVIEPFFLVESLLIFSENEIMIAIFTSYCFIWHINVPPMFFGLN